MGCDVGLRFQIITQRFEPLILQGIMTFWGVTLILCLEEKILQRSWFHSHIGCELYGKSTRAVWEWFFPT